MSCVPDHLSEKKSKKSFGLIVDSFAGGGGASLGIELALGRGPRGGGAIIDAAINHDPIALAIHRANHPHTTHYCQDITQLHPREVTQGRPVDLLWASPDCKHFSKAKGGKPRSQSIRDLPWTVALWAETVRPKLIILENVEEFRDWGPLDADHLPIKSRKGETFAKWIGRFRACGYQVEWRELRASDYGAPTIRKRLFVIARRDGRPIVWPEPTHGPGREPYRTAAEIIDWSLPCPSIFERPRPLAENTCKRIAKGIVRFVLENPSPFIVTYYGAKGDGDFRGQDLGEPLATQTTENRHALIAPLIVKYKGHCEDGQNLKEPLHTVQTKPHYGLVVPHLLHNTTGHGPGDPVQPIATVTTGHHHYLTAAHLARHFGNSVGADCNGPAPTVTAGGMGKTALVTAFIAQHNGGFYDGAGRNADAPLSTITHRGTQQQLVTSSLIKLRGTCRDGQPVDAPMPTVTAGGNHIAEVRAFLIKYYGCGLGQDLQEPLHTITVKDRMGLVTVRIGGEPFVLADIGMRMLQPRELFRAQGFPDSYIIDPVYNGKPLAKSAQVRACGNSVCPPLAAALVRANYVESDGALDLTAEPVFKEARI